MAVKVRMRLVGLLAFVALTIAAGLTAGVVALDRYLDPFNGQRFDPAAWSAANSQGRGPMARDAIRHLPMGLPKARVRELLGAPDPFPGPSGGSVDGFGNRLRHAETWSYHLGCWSWYGLDSAFLYVHFGPDGSVVAAEVTGG